MNLKEKILSDIRAGKVAMRPKLVYAAQLGVLSVTALSIVAVTVFIVGAISFILRASSHEVLLGFGVSGVEAFFIHFPWGLALLNGVLVVLFQWLVRTFKFGYRVPIVVTMLALVVGAGVLGFLIDRVTPFNDRAFSGRSHLPPPMRGLYEDAPRPPKGSGICKCTVLSVQGDTLIVEDVRDATSTLTVRIMPHSRHATSTGLAPGDTVFIAGEERDGVIEAFGIKKIK